MEVFRGYFYNQKKNKARSREATILMLLGFALLMVVLLGGMFAGLSVLLCSEFYELGLGWLYFLLMGMIALLLAVFGSVFNTYSGLYKARDNDLLLSMPISVRDIMIARLLNVYLMGLMYASVVIVPAVVVYWILGKFSITTVVGGIALVLFISLLALVLSCVLGWVVAMISSRLKHKSFVTVIISLVAFGAYYFVCFRLNSLINTLLANAILIGDTIHGKAIILHWIGRIGEGYLPSIIGFTAGAVALTLLCGWCMSRNFLKLATVTDKVAKREYKETTAKQKGLFAAVLGKEFSRFTSSALYMLNCGLGIVFMLAFIVVLIFKGNSMVEMVSGVFGPASTAFLFCMMVSIMGSTNFVAAPSVSLEGKNIWLLQSLPVDPKLVLMAKLSVQLLVTNIPVLALSIAGAFLVAMTVPELILFILFPQVFTLLISAMDLALGIRFANLVWTNEMAPIKQSAAVTIALFGGWGLSAAVAGLYFWKGHLLGFTPYVGICTVVSALLAAVLLWWILKFGSKRFMAL